MFQEQRRRHANNAFSAGIGALDPARTARGAPRNARAARSSCLELTSGFLAGTASSLDLIFSGRIQPRTVTYRTLQHNAPQRTNTDATRFPVAETLL
jgi:hypothetical protein